MASVGGGACIVTSLVSAPVERPRSVDDVRAFMHETVSRDESVRISGAGTWRDAGPPIDAARTLSLASLSGIVAYVPGDLTITAYAGTTLSELSHATAAHGQWLGLDPAGVRDGTIGATIATASSGPLSHAFGTPRDLVLGLDAVTGYGDVVRAGGRVVKNVAGFDLVRLYTGSWGTLGAITSLTMRLRALPVHDITLTLAIDNAAHFRTLLLALRRDVVSLLACEWIDGATAQAFGIGDGRDVFLLRLGGNHAFIRGQRAVLDAVGSSRECDAIVWARIAMLDRDATAVVRVSGAVSALSERITRIRTALSAGGCRDVALHGSVHRGLVRIVGADDVSQALSVMHHVEPNEQRITERAPAAWWAVEPDPFSGALEGRIRDAFDPKHLCNRRQATRG